MTKILLIRSQTHQKQTNQQNKL